MLKSARLLVCRREHLRGQPSDARRRRAIATRCFVVGAVRRSPTTQYRMGGAESAAVSPNPLSPSSPSSQSPSHPFLLARHICTLPEKAEVVARASCARDGGGRVLRWCARARLRRAWLSVVCARARLKERRAAVYAQLKECWTAVVRAACLRKAELGAERRLPVTLRWTCLWKS